MESLKNTRLRSKQINTVGVRVNKHSIRCNTNVGFVI